MTFIKDKLVTVEGLKIIGDNQKKNKKDIIQLKESLNELKTRLGSNLVKKSIGIWQFGNTLNVNNNTISSYVDNLVNRMSLKPSEWIKLEVGKKYKFYHDSDIFKLSCNTHNGTRVNKDSGWIMKDTVYEFTPISGYEKVTLAIARSDGGNIKMEDFFDNLPNIVLCEYDVQERDLKFIDESRHELLYLDKTKTITGIGDATSGEVIVSTNLNRATYTEIIDMSNVQFIDINGEMLKHYDVAINAYNVNKIKADYGWGGARRIVLMPYTSYISVNFREKENNVINGDCLLYNNDLSIGIGINAVANPISKSIPKIYKQNKFCHVAHRGYQVKAPENSIPAFVESAIKGFDGIETDIQMSSDGTLYCMHDDTVDRTTNGTGIVTQLSNQYLNSIVINHNGQYTDEEMRVPKFTEYLKVCKKYGCIPVIELKKNGINESGLRTMIDELNTFGLLEKCVIISFSLELLAKLRKMCSIIYIEPLFAINNGSILYASAFGNSGINTVYSQVSADLVKKAHEIGLNVSSNVITSQETADVLLGYGCDTIVSHEYYGINY